jgi:oxygen-dependent protoporphyrinogen oxidase
MADLIVLGAGAAGLSAAHFARKAGLKVEIFEASAHPGGRMQTTREKGFTVEHGPLGWLDGEEALEEICADLHLNIIRSKVADTHRYIQHAGKLFPLPQGPAAFATSKLLNWKEKLRFLSEPMADLPADGTKETVRDFANRRFGNGFEKKIVRPLIAGLFAAKSKEISMSAMFPGIIAAEAKHGSLTKSYRRWAMEAAVPICTVAGGLGTLAHALAATHGDLCHVDSPVDTALFEEGWWYIFHQGTQLARARKLLVALPPSAMAMVLRDYLGELRKSVDELAAPNLVSVSMAFSKSNVQDACAGFGYMADRKHRSPLLSVQFMHAIFPDSAPNDQVLLRCMLGGTPAPDFGKNSDSECLERALQEIEPALGIKGIPTASWVTKHAGGVPVYRPSHHSLVRKLSDKLAHYENLSFAGDAFFGIGLNAAFAHGKKWGATLPSPA